MPARISMTNSQREALLGLPDDEAPLVRYHSLDAIDLAAINGARTPETRLSYALQLCCLRYPGRHLRRGELLSAVMLDHIAEQIGVVLSQVERWTGFVSHFEHVSSELPPGDERTFLAALIAEATNLGPLRNPLPRALPFQGPKPQPWFGPAAARHSESGDRRRH